MDPVSPDLGVEMTYTSVDKLVPKPKQKNHTIKEEIWTAYQSLQFCSLSSIMIRYLWMVQTSNLKLFQVKQEFHPATVHAWSLHKSILSMTKIAR